MTDRQTQRAFNVYLDDDARALLNRLEPIAKRERRSLSKMLILAAERGADAMERDPLSEALNSGDGTYRP